MAPPFTRFATPHLVAIALTLATPLALSWIVRRAPQRERVIAWALIVILGLGRVGHFVFLLREYEWRTLLPLHLCDVALVAAFAALLWRSRWGFELAYFFGMAATLQAVLTPNIARDFPDPVFFTFFLWHSGVVLCVLYAIVGLRMRPGRGALGRIYLAYVGYGAIAGLINLLLGTNYGFLSRKPVGGNIIDVMGPWPWYLLGLAIAGALMFAVLALPFTIGRLVRARRSRRA